ncbi:Alpha-E domain-containing protein [Rubrivivax sp. A210]|uniref:circularly permuted type 2 ATP-grasp protein n=1 Tax=Rubrivivax sp. A210 TaxID=2772301 RepID=UPI0019185A9C|nr:circularly permuted type 2 ATP-grasp protein [Rubrivivax sp. A210]CAD5374600.1 Alpha-E domain-containing protein [Rubrivivax sp. A210]
MQQQFQGSFPFDRTPGPGHPAAHALASRVLPAEAGVWDELRDGQGALRAAWQRFAQTVPAPASGLEMVQDLDRRVEQVGQRIALDGVTHNVFADGGVASRPWSLELLPLLIEPADWAQIEAGVVQRAELQERVLADLYGPQRLLHEGLLPPSLLLRHPGWLRPMRGVAPPGGLRLFIVAFDIARGPDGRWWLMSQRTQGPSGLGYVLHNRLVISRQFPDAFRDLRVQHIASSYRRLLDTLEITARQVSRQARDGETPRIVLLTPGPYAETYFEHAYLARYLGLPLVEGGDLTVRGERLFLRTVEGLEPVHGLLRRVDDDWCDPLELRPDSALGVPGLIQAARAGTVVMANALGSAFLESPAIQGFMPGIAERLTGAQLLLPSLPTWWCGEPAAWADVRGGLHDKIVRSTFPRGGLASQVGQAAAVAEDPDAWTVQGRLRYSRAPIWGNGAVTARPSMVRVYAIADGGGRWHVLPGGMTRVAQREEGSVSMQRGGTSLDTWVLTEGAVDSFSMLPQRLQVDDIVQRRRPVSSRTGENLFWLGRYTERTEQLVRLARATLTLIDADTDVPPAVLQALSTLAISAGLAPPGVPTLLQSSHLFERAVLAGLGDETGATSAAYNLAALERAGMALRERLSSEHWGLIAAMREGFQHTLRSAHGELPTLAQVMPALDRLALELAAVTGAQSDRMTRDHGWRLLTVGRLIERLGGVCARLEAFVAAGALASAAGIDLLLELFDSVITFRARYQRHEDLLALADLLVFDSANPRAFAGVLRRLRTEIGKLPGLPEVLQPLRALLPAEGAGLTLEDLRDADDAEIARALLALAHDLRGAAVALAERVGERYFTLAQGMDQRV